MKNTKLFLLSGIFALALTIGMFSNVQPQQQTLENQTAISMDFGFVQTAYAQDVPAPAEPAAETTKPEASVPELPGTKDDPATNLDTEIFLQAAMVALGSWKSLGAMGVAALITQLLMLMLRTPLGSFAGKWKLVVVYLLSVVSGLLVLKVSGMSWGAAALHTQTLAAFQAWAHQMYKQFVEKSGETAT